MTGDVRKGLRGEPCVGFMKHPRGILAMDQKGYQAPWVNANVEGALRSSWMCLTWNSGGLGFVDGAC